MNYFVSFFGLEDPGMFYALGLFSFIFLLFVFYGVIRGGQMFRQQNISAKSDQLLHLFNSLRPPEVDPDTPLPSVAQIKTHQWFSH